MSATRRTLAVLLAELDDAIRDGPTGEGGRLDWLAGRLTNGRCRADWSWAPRGPQIDCPDRDRELCHPFSAPRPDPPTPTALLVGLTVEEREVLMRGHLPVGDLAVTFGISVRQARSRVETARKKLTANLAAFALARFREAA